MLLSFLAAQQSNYKFLGCFLEDNLLSLGEVSGVLNSTSPKACSKFCSEKKYLFFTLKNEYDIVLQIFKFITI